MNRRTASIDREYYDILEVDRKASKTEIDQAYKRLAKKWHPDKNRNNQEKATEMFQKISTAYKTLSDPETRRIYDMYGKDGIEKMDSRSGGPGGPGGPGGGPPQAKPIMHQMPVSLRDLYLNNTLVADFEYKNSCDECDGTGSKNKLTQQCDQCNGAGHAVKITRMGPFMQQTIGKCDGCHGKGYSINDDDKCDKCLGKGHVKSINKVDITLDASNMNWGMRMMVPGKGHNLRDHIQGDVIIELVPDETSVSEQDQKFKRVGKNNLQVTIPITLSMALTGVDVMLETLDNRWLRIQLKDEIVTPKTSKVIPSEGMPIGSSRGDLLIDFDIEFPNMIKPNHVQYLRKALTGSPLDKKYNTLIQTNKDKIAHLYTSLDDYTDTHHDDEYGSNSDDDIEFDPRSNCAQQ